MHFTPWHWRLVLNGGSGTESGDGAGGDGDDGAGAGGDDGAGKDGKDSRVDALLAELARVRAQRREAEEKLEAQRKEREDAERAEAEKRGEFQGLYTTEKERADALADRVAEYEARENTRVEATKARNTERVEALPAGIKELVPEGLGPDALAAWLDKAATLAAAADDEGHPRGTRSRGGQPGAEDPVPAEARAEVERLAKKQRVEPEVVWARLSPRLREQAIKGQRLPL